jgi:hypothetical protein
LIRPDTDVRAKGPICARDPHGACPAGLARLLLFLLRKAPVVSLLLASSACVIPVVPGFEDPHAVPNYPPQILDPNPEIGAIVSGQIFSVVVREPNPGDTIHLHWIADLQPGTSTARTIDEEEFPPSPDGQVQDVFDEVEVTCEGDFLDKSLESHSIHLLVGDEKFDRDNPRRLVNGRQAVEAAWTLVLRCR